MTQKTLPTLPKAKGPIRRTVRREYRAGDQVGFRTKSFTKNDDTTYFPTLDAATGEWSCTCPSAHFRPNAPCKHVKRAAQNLVRAGEAPASLLTRLGAQCCFRCMAVNNLFPMAHDDGTPAHDVWVCKPCTNELRYEARRREIEQIRVFAAELERQGEGVSARHYFDQANHFERQLQQQIEKETQNVA